MNNTSRQRWPWLLVIGGIVAIVALIVAVGLMRTDNGGLALDPTPTPGTPDDDPDTDTPDPGALDAATAAEFAAAWVARQIDPDGSVEIGFAGPAGNATQAALALAAAGVGGDAFDRAVAYVEENLDDYAERPDGDDPGALGYVLLLVEAAGADPRDFGGYDLVDRIEAVRHDDGDDTGLFGAADPTWDGVFRQSIALLGLVAAGAEPDDTAVEWLLDQQCDDGGWPSYRSPDNRTEEACDPEVAAPDSNSTAVAMQALAALDVEPTYDPLDWLEAIQSDNGGFGYGPDYPATDANSTGLVIQALVAFGEDPRSGRWVRPGDADPVSALLALQIGCDAPEDARGAVAFQPEEDGSLEPNAATFQATWGLAQAPFPLGEHDLGDNTPHHC